MLSSRVVLAGPGYVCAGGPNSSMLRQPCWLPTFLSSCSRSYWRILCTVRPQSCFTHSSRGRCCDDV
jgi:hypothetical protein